MDYNSVIEYLFQCLPSFEQHGKDGYKEGLSNTFELDKHYGSPHRHYATIHIAGTNGKGTCSHSIAAVLQTCGYRVGLYTSPHLVDFRERIKINGQPISREYVTSFVEEGKAFFDTLHPSFFELTTAMAFKYFKDMNVDIAIIEVGLGGRLDCTNIITPILSVITNISYDHTQYLGTELKQIAEEKAGIIKPGVPVVIGEVTEETKPVFEEKARLTNSKIIYAQVKPGVVQFEKADDGHFIYQTWCMGRIDSPLCGDYQKNNMNTILKSIRTLAEMGYVSDCSDATVRERCTLEQKEALKNVCELTGLQGRWQQVRTNPQVICDTGHNVAAWEYLGKQIAALPNKNKVIVFGMVNDKDVEGVLQLLPQEAYYIFTSADSRRSLSAIELYERAMKHHLNGEHCASVKEAYNKALSLSMPDDFIFVGGSNYLVGEFLKEFC